ncbi:Uncharacterized protein HZ326_27439 [Fusarium oxysporum f. sp. albedinis]|nr:Uncharacterized protein HZ326_27439 [Fusarium oxysporum f. sp. albedinis]
MTGAMVDICIANVFCVLKPGLIKGPRKPLISEIDSPTPIEVILQSAFWLDNTFVDLKFFFLFPLLLRLEF